MPLPLEGITVLDLTRLIPGPFCTLILADLGAEVIKVEQPGTGDYERQIGPFQEKMAYRFMLLNRNKKSIGLNLKQDKGREIFIDLVRQADVVVEGFRPGVMSRLGLGYDDVLRGVNEGLVYCSLTSYGHSGPYRDKVAHDINILAATGLLDLIGAADGPPVIPGVQLVDTVTALYAVIGIQAALAAKTKTGKGQHVDLSMHDCAFSLMFDSVRYPLAEDRVPVRGKERLMGGLANYNIYQTRDNRYIAVGALEKKFHEKLLKEIGLAEYIEQNGSVTASEVNPEKEEVIRNRFREIFKEKSSKEWQQILGSANVFFSPVDTVADALEDEQLKSREMVVDTEHPVAGAIKQIGSPIKLSEAPVQLERLSAPRLGEHSVALLGKLGLNDDQIRDLTDKGVVS
jgi:crotonobetainyl-CoA:carnitine CoA-transferase CaiB-like acyl-CoA transferase